MWLWTETLLSHPAELNLGLHLIMFVPSLFCLHVSMSTISSGSTLCTCSSLLNTNTYHNSKNNLQSIDHKESTA